MNPILLTCVFMGAFCLALIVAAYFFGDTKGE